MTDKLGQRYSRQRDLIHKIITSANGPITVDEIHELATQDNPIGIATVYRTINLLLEGDKILKTTLSDGQARYENANKDKHHHHFLCRTCDKAVCIETAPIKCAGTNTHPQGFIVESHELIVHGICKSCSE